MTNMQLLEAIGMLDEETILDAEREPVRRAKLLPVMRARTVRRITAFAACICLLFGGATLAYLGGRGGMKDNAANSPDGNPTEAVAGETDSGDATMAGGENTIEATTVPATTTTVPTEATTESFTTVATTGAPVPETTAPADRLIVYEESFEGYADTEKTSDVLDALGWRKLTVAENGVYSESEVTFAIREGRLYFDNISAAGSGNDGYYAISVLDNEYMKPIVAGKYTLEYDMEYTDAGNASHYAAIITELSDDGRCYNSFHFRIGGTANHQSHFYGGWKTYSAYDPATDLNPSADDPTGAEGTPLLQKLLGSDIAQYGDKLNFAGVKVTVRLRWDPERGHSVYMKTAEMADFIQVSEPSRNADGVMYVGSWDGWSVALKVGGAIEGYLDNIRIWTGWGEYPGADGEWYRPIK